jgi:hypothetical protein
MTYEFGQFVHRAPRWHGRKPVVLTAAGSIKFDKEKSRRKFDGMVALVNAVAAAIGGGFIVMDASADSN